MSSDVENIKLLRATSKRLVIGHLRKLNGAIQRGEEKRSREFRDYLETEMDNLHDLHLQVLEFEENDKFIDEVSDSYDKTINSHDQVILKIKEREVKRVKDEITGHLGDLKHSLSSLKEIISHRGDRKDEDFTDFTY